MEDYPGQRIDQVAEVLLLLLKLLLLLTFMKLQISGPNPFIHAIIKIIIVDK